MSISYSLSGRAAGLFLASAAGEQDRGKHRAALAELLRHESGVEDRIEVRGEHAMVPADPAPYPVAVGVPPALPLIAVLGRPTGQTRPRFRRAAGEAGVKNRETEPAAGGEHRGDGGQGTVQVVDVHQCHMTQHAVVGQPVPPLRVRGVAVQIANTLRPGRLELPAMGEQFRGEIRAGDLRPAARQRPADPSVSAGQVEDALSSQVVRKKSQRLFAPVLREFGIPLCHRVVSRRRIHHAEECIRRFASRHAIYLATLELVWRRIIRAVYGLFTGTVMERL